MKKIVYPILLGCLASLLLVSCAKDNGPSVSDNILAYNIPEIAVTSNYTVGSWYYDISTFNVNIKEVPVLGKYNSAANGAVTPAIMSKHIEYAGKAGIDFFLFPIRSANNADSNNYKRDSNMVKSFLDVNTTNMKFALAYNLNTGGGGFNITISNLIDSTANAAKLAQFYRDFERLAPLMKNTNYMKVNGKILLYIMNAQNLYAINNQAIYTTLRSRMTALGIELYIVGMQDRWTPPARYPFRFQKCVDAIGHQTFLPTDYDRFYLLPQMIDQNWQYSAKYYKDNWAIDYVPNIYPAYNYKILNTANANPVFPRSDTGSLYKKLCNVAKMNANPTTRLIMIDGFNKFDEDLQLEPAVSYGELYLNITKSDFKK